jgi:hypothetical protein
MVASTPYICTVPPTERKLIMHWYMNKAFKHSSGAGHHRLSRTVPESGTTAFSSGKVRYRYRVSKALKNSLCAGYIKSKDGKKY